MHYWMNALTLLDNTAYLLETGSLEPKGQEFPLAWQTGKEDNFARAWNSMATLENMQHARLFLQQESFTFLFFFLAHHPTALSIPLFLTPPSVPMLLSSKARSLLGIPGRNNG